MFGTILAMIGHSSPNAIESAVCPVPSESTNRFLFGVGIMNQQQEERRAAAQAFYESLEQLQQSLESADHLPENTATPVQGAAETELTVAETSLDAWEAAIADIDQFMQGSPSKDP